MFAKKRFLLRNRRRGRDLWRGRGRAAGGENEREDQSASHRAECYVIPSGARNPDRGVVFDWLQCEPMRSSISALLLLFVAITAGAAPVEPAQLDRAVAEMLAAWQLPGVAVAVVQDDQVVFAKGYGVREIGKAAPVTADTMFQIASTTKAFTTTAMAILVDEKKMSWDDPVRKHIDYFRLSDPCADSLVTLRDIVSHRTGLSRNDELWDYGPWSREEILRRIGSVKLNRPFRSAYQYQNIMFMAAGEAVSNTAGVPWNVFLKTRVFEPLGMTRTVVAESDWSRGEHAVAHHFDDASATFKPVSMYDYDSLGPAGSMKSTVRDMAQWIRLQLNEGTVDGKRIVSSEALAETKKPQMVLPADDSARLENPETNINTYGMGWRVQDYRGQLMVWHSGSLNRFRTHVVLLPRLRSGFVLMSNSDRGYGLIALRQTIADLIVADGSRDWNAFYLNREKVVVDEEVRTRRDREAKRHRNTKPSRELAAYAGTYSSPAFGDARITADKGALVLQWQRLTIPLTHFHFDTFTAFVPDEDLDEQVVFSLGADGEVNKLTVFGQEFSRKN